MITEAAIKAAMKRLPASGKKSLELRDTGPRGGGRLVITIRMRDQKFTAEWYAVWWRDEDRKSLKIGVFPDMTVAEARRTFQEQYAPEILAGRDPVGPKARRERRGVTVKDLFDGYVEHLKSQGKSAKMAKHVLLGNGGAIKHLGEGKRAADVTAEHLREHLAGIHSRGAVVMARDARAYLHAAFAWAMQSANAYTSAAGRTDWGIKFNPVASIPTDKSEEANRAGDRHLSPAELRHFWGWLNERRESRVAAAALMLVAATGQRLTEILVLGDASYDRAEEMLDWSKTKNGMPHAIPLPRQAVTILETIVTSDAREQGLFFPHATKAGECASIAAAEKVVKDYLKKHPKVPHFTPRDLRRTWKTLSGAAGISKEVRDRLQNHARTDVSSRHYDRYDYLAEKRAGMKTWAAYLERILTGQLDNPVTQLQVAG